MFKFIRQWKICRLENKIADLNAYINAYEEVKSRVRDPHNIDLMHHIPYYKGKLAALKNRLYQLREF
jgi:hypothetical protein